MVDFAPVALFVYNRPKHTIRTLDALRRNELAEHTDLLVFSDGPKDSADNGRVDEVRKILDSIEGFRSTNIIKREANAGLAASVIGGVTRTIEEFGKVIVLEDDLVTSPAFLAYMNRALDRYENCEQVWHVSGWSFPLSEPPQEDAFLWRHMVCWGWGTWADRWDHFEKDPDKLISTFTARQLHRFNLNGAEKLWGQVLDNKDGKIDTWAIFWYATIFQNNGLCLNPSRSFVFDIGKDGSGTNVKRAESRNLEHEPDLATNAQIDFPAKLGEAAWALSEYKRYQKSIRGTRIGRLLGKLERLVQRSDRGAGRAAGEHPD